MQIKNITEIVDKYNELFDNYKTKFISKSGNVFYPLVDCCISLSKYQYLPADFHLDTYNKFLKENNDERFTYHVLIKHESIKYLISALITFIISWDELYAISLSNLKYKRKISLITNKKDLINTFIVSYSKNKWSESLSCLIRLLELDNIDKNILELFFKNIITYEK